MIKVEYIFRMVLDLNKKTDGDFINSEENKLIHLAHQILKNWEFQVKHIQVIQSGEMALVWKVQTDKGPICLKRLHRQEKKALFSIFAQQYLKKKGVHVPGIYLTKNKESYTRIGAFLFVVYDWIEGTHLSEENRNDMTLLIRELAKFHQISIGFQPPSGVNVFSKLGKWPQYYVKRCQQMESWKILAKITPDDPFAEIYLKEIDEFIKKGWHVHDQLLKSAYFNWVEKTKEKPNLCHPDYGTGNTLFGNDGKFWIIDLDTVCFDIPIRDIRKLIESYVSPTRSWLDALRFIIHAYESVSPLAEEQKQVMYIDFMFPYDIYDLAHNTFIRKEETSVEKLLEVIELERNKYTEFRGLK